MTFEPDFYKYVRDSFTPVGMVIDVSKERIGPSNLLHVPVMVINDLESQWSGEVTLRMDKEGKAAWKQAKQANVKAFGARTTKFQVQFPNEITR